MPLSRLAVDEDGKQFPPEPKVVNATAASYLTTLLITLLTNIAQDESHALLLGAAPEWLETILLPVLPAALTYAVGWLTKHQHRRPASGVSGVQAGTITG